MSNTKQLKSAVALLATIAVLDNFIFVELEPGFESMERIEPSSSLAVANTEQAQKSSTQPSATNDFWIDRQVVSGADFAKFLEATGYVQQEVTFSGLQAVSSEYVAYIVAADDETWRSEAGNANWEKPSGSMTMNHTTLAGQDNLKVGFKDALAYCNWLGKDLPTAKQLEHIATASHDKNAYRLGEFRCAKNI